MKTCVDCGTELRNGAGTQVMVHMDDPDGGYDRVRMPACRRCALERRGYECEHCGQLHETQRDAYECCVGTTKAPDCIECGRRMEVGASGYHPVRGPDITWAECECCPIGWGRFTGWELLDGEETCKHVEDDGDSEQRVMTDGGQSTDVTGRKMGPQFIPKIECPKCGTEHHPDAANGEYVGHCRECSGFLPRPTETQRRRFSDFIVWKSQFLESDRRSLNPATEQEGS